MKVGITTYPVAFQKKGGLEVQIRQTMQALQRLGVEVTLIDLGREKFKSYDIIHHFSHSSFRIFESAQSTGIPLVLSPLVELAQSRLRLQRIRFVNYILHKTFGQEFRTKWHDTIGSLRLADAILPLTEAENSVIKALVPEVVDRTHVVPNGITEDFFAASPALFRTTYPDMGKFVLVASSVVQYKNQVAVIRAARSAGYHTVLVGSKSSEHYFNQCMQAGGENVTYLGELEYPSPMLTSLFAAAGVVVLASMQEPFGLVPFEALAAGVPSILTTRSGVDWEGSPPYFQRVRPDSDDDIYNALKTAMEAPPAPSLCRQLVQDMRWSAVAERILDIYKSVLR